jgi:copper transport protein
MKRAITVLLTVLAATLALGTPPASAHAALLRTTPGDAEILQAAPAEVTLTFGEPVGIGLGNLRVLSAQGDRVDSGALTRTADGTVVHIPLKPAIAEGTYVVVWRVVSEDSHPVSGAFTFSVGAPSVDSRELLGRGNLTSITEAPRGPGVALGVARFVGFCGVVLLLGGAIFCLVMRLPLPRRLLAVGAVASLLSSVSALLLQGPYASGRGIGDAFNSSLLDAVLHSRYGGATATRVALSLVAVGLVLLGLRRLLLIAALGIAVTWSLAGHAGVGTWQPWTFVFDVTHLLTVSAWVGGLVLLVRGLRGRWSLAEQALVLPRWSRLATWSVAALVATGTFAGIREVGELDAQFSTRYGVLLLVKIGLVGLMLLFALIGRAHVREHYGVVAKEPTEEDVAGLRRSTAIETGLAVIVLAVTAMLVNTTPAKAAYAPPYSGRSTAGPLTVQVDIYPARKGLNGLHVYTVGAGGRTVDVEEVSGVVSREGDDITLHPKHKSLGHYEDLRVVLPQKGHWTITLQVRTSDTDSYETKQEFDVK